ncbi:hypothetical protein NDU88_002369 [Pleurodeles waltl]|uniref:Myb-like domain-containing protein n=1 Tax=Pleurodeles waltl TaxID=8319 RepID=A0AAV7WNA2_PLEWA|nr:hypothetical protein NDU88_002369 [Pleurodeles waltl]
MARVTGERAPAFTSEELERLVDGVLPQYGLLYGPPDQQDSAHQKKDKWCAIAKEVWTLGVYGRQSTHCRKRWEDLKCWARKAVGPELGMASQQGRAARWTLTPLMARILAVAYPELDGPLRESQQPQGGYLWNKGTKSKSHKQVGDGQMPRKCQLRVQRSFDWTEEAEVSAGTKRARDFPFGGRIPLALESRAEVFSRRKDANKPC